LQISLAHILRTLAQILRTLAQVLRKAPHLKLTQLLRLTSHLNNPCKPSAVMSEAVLIESAPFVVGAFCDGDGREAGDSTGGA
jgi:hypothetical protein